MARTTLMLGQLRTRAAIVAFETSLFTAQLFDKQALNLLGDRARGGPKPLANETFYFGINDVVSGDYRTWGGST